MCNKHLCIYVGPRGWNDERLESVLVLGWIFPSGVGKLLQDCYFTEFYNEICPISD